MRIRCADSALREALATALPPGDAPGDGLVFVAGSGFADWVDAEDELAEAFRESQRVAVADGPVVYVTAAAALLGRTEPLDAAVAVGLLAGARAVATERRRFDGYATTVAVGADVPPDTVATAIGALVAVRGSNGQPFVLGGEQIGAALP